MLYLSYINSKKMTKNNSILVDLHDMKDDFRKLCKKKDTSMTRELRNYVREQLNEKEC